MEEGALAKGTRKVEPEKSQDQQESTVSSKSREERILRGKETRDPIPVLRLLFESLL